MCSLRWIGTLVVLGCCMMVFEDTSLGALCPLSTERVLQDPSILEEIEPVDVVYTWVDGKDSAWKKTRAHWLKKTKNVTKEARKAIRFRNHDELKYSLRSIHAFAPFVRHIFIVTSGQRPKWLANHHKITVVTHKELFSHKNDLPTFNSIAIEANLHHIPGLANHYIYFNDDVFLGKPVTKGDFFVRPYKIKVFLSQKKIFDNDSSFKSGMYGIVSRNMAEFFEQNLSRPDAKVSKEDLYYHRHTPFPMIKWIAQLTEKRFPDAFSSCSSHKFRSMKDLSLTNGLIPQYALRLGLGVASEADDVTLLFRGKQSSDKAHLKALLKRKPMFFCIQDIAEKNDTSSEACLKKFLSGYFPNPAPWEKSKKRKHK